MSSQALIHTASWIGFIIVIVAAVFSNIAFFKLNRAVNKAYDIRNRIDPWSMIFPQRASMRDVLKRVRLYKAAYPDGQDWKRMKLAYWMVGAGLALSATSVWLGNHGN